MSGSFSYTVNVRKEDVNQDSRVLNIIWHKGDTKPKYTSERGFGKSIKVYFGDGTSKTYAMVDFSKEGSSNEKEFEIEFTFNYAAIRHRYTTERTYDVRVEWEGDKCPEISFKDTIVDHIESPLPMMFSDSGLPASVILSFFHGSTIRRVETGVFKSWAYVRDIKWLFRDAQKLEYVDGDLFNDMPQLRTLIGIFMNIGTWTPNLRFKNKNISNICYLFEGSIPPLGVIYAIKGSTTYNEIKEPTNRNIVSNIRILEMQHTPKEDLFDKPDGYFMKDGRRFDAVFYHRVAGVQNFGMVNITGIDLGQVYTKGVSTIQTGYKDSTGIDVGEKLLADANVRFIPKKLTYALLDRKGRGWHCFFKYKCIGNWSHNFSHLVSSIPDIVKIKGASYIKETQTLGISVDVVVTGDVTKPFVFGLTDEYAGLMFTSEPMIITTTQVRGIDTDHECSDSCDSCDSCDGCSDNCDGSDFSGDTGGCDTSGDWGCD